MTSGRELAPGRRDAVYWWSAGMRAIVWSLLGDAHGRLLDAGCGPGLDLVKLPLNVWGVGLDHSARGVAIRPFVQAEADRIPFRSGSFDVTLALDLLEQKDVDPGAVLAEIRRVMRPRGVMLVRVPAHPWLYGPHDRAWGGGRRYRKGEVKALIEGAGFTICRLTYANSYLFPLAALVRLGGRVGLVRGDLLHLAKPFGGLLSGVLNSEARRLRKHDLPAGLSLMCLAET